MISVLSIVGTRPEVIKLAPLIRALEQAEQIRSTLLATAQHRGMLDQALETFGLSPDVDLDLTSANQSLTDFAASVLAGVGRFLDQHRPDLVLVQGDTTTVAAAALAAFYQRVPLGHVEAGLRTEDRQDPFPEEINRRLASLLASYHFAPTESARKALLKEGVADPDILVSGNTVVDSLQWILSRVSASGPAGFSPETTEEFSGVSRTILVTAHRRENLGLPLERICEALLRLVERNPDVVVVYPVHRNPAVWEPVHRLLSNHDRIHLISPQSYEDFVMLLNRCHFVLTDSGGVQEEAPAMAKPTLVLREKTERPEGIAAGTAKLVGTQVDRILSESERLLTDEAEYRKMARASCPYGDGRAAQRIVEYILRIRVGS